MHLRYALLFAALISVLDATFAHAADWKKYRGEFAGDSADCIDFDSIKPDSQGLTRFRRYVIDDDKACGRPNQYNIVEAIAVACSAVRAAGPNRDNFPVKFYSFDSASKRWEEGGNASRQFSRVMQYVCRNRQ